MAKRNMSKYVASLRRKPVMVGFISAVAVSILTLAFLWPAKTASPRHIPIGIIGNDKQQIMLVTKMLEANAKDKVALVEVSDRTDAIDKMKQREIFGTIIISSAPEVLTASANGPALNGVITNIATNLERGLSGFTSKREATRQASQVTLKKTDIIPAHAASFDLAQLSLPIMLGGTIGSVVILAFVRSSWHRLAALSAYSILVGASMFLILHTWFNVVPNNAWALVGTLGLGSFAIGSFVMGFYTLLGSRGIGLATLINLLIANPLSGMMVPALFLPWIWGTVGQLFAVGATGTLLRGALYFPVAEVILMPLIVLLVWSALGVTAILSRSRDQIIR